MRDEWKCVLKGDGELYLMMDGQPVMLKLYADNWDIVHKVHVTEITYRTKRLKISVFL